MAGLTARLLGTPQFAMGDRAIDPGNGRAGALLAYLVATRQVQSRDRLAGFFWPDVPQRNALASLRTALYDLRRALGRDAAPRLVVERTRVAVAVDGLDTDVARLEAVAAGADDLDALEAAVAAWRGDFLDGVVVPDAADFDDWLFLERERLANLYLSALCRLGERYADRGDFGRAAEAARRVLAIDPLREEIHRALMSYLALDGQRGAAIAQYRACQELLRRELDIEPLAATTAAYQRILADDVAPPHADGPSAVARAAARRTRALPDAAGPIAPERRPSTALGGVEGPIVGREAERARIASAWSSAAAGAGGVIVVSGEAGIGKSRLVAQAAADAEGALVLVGRCWESTACEPYAPIAEALRAGLDAVPAHALDLPAVWRGELARVLPELAGRFALGEPTPLDGIRERDRLFEGLRATLVALSAARPVLLVLDDAQWADETTLSFTHYVARQIASLPVLIVVTYRDEDLGAERRTLLRDLERSGVRIALGPLDASTTADLVASLAGVDPAPERLGQRLFERTAGNPFFVVETVRALVEQGSLARDASGAWSTTPGSAEDGYAALPIPPSVGLIVDGRLERLSDDARALLDGAAILRRDFAFDLVQRLSGLPAPAALDALDALIDAGLLDESGDAEADAAHYDFTHALVRDRVYGSLSGARRQYLHRQVAGLLEAQDPPPADRLAYHAMRGGVRDRACFWSMRAGEAALRVYAGENALAHYQTARQLAASPLERFAALSGIGDAFAGLGRPAEAVRAYREAQDEAPDEGERAEILRRIARVHERRGAYDESIAAYGEARALLRARPVSMTAVRTLDGLATVYVRLGRTEEAVALCQDALALLAMVGSQLDDEARRRGEAWIHNTLGMAHLHAGDFHRAREHLGRSLDLNRALDDRLGQATLLNNLGVVDAHCGDDARALEHYAASLAIKDAIGDGYGRAIALTNIALVETHLERWEESGRHLDEAAAAADGVGASWLVPEIRRVSAQRALALGDVADASRCAEAALAAAEILGVPAHIGVAHRVLGAVEAARRGAEVADEHFRTSLAVFEMLENDHELAKTRAAYAEVLLARGEDGEAAGLIEAALATFSRSGASGRADRLARLRAHRDG